MKRRDQTMSPLIRPTLTVLSFTLLLGAYCNRDRECSDLRGETVEMALLDPVECNENSLLACSSFRIPDRLVVRVLDEPAQRRDLLCEVYRGELLSGDFGLELLGPIDGTLGVGGDFGLAELARVPDTECYGRLYVSFARLAATDPDDPLVPPPEGGANWLMELVFEPTEEEPCRDVQPRCVQDRCVGVASRAAAPSI